MYDFIIMDRGQILLFQPQIGESKIEVRLTNKSVWLSDDQIAELSLLTLAILHNIKRHTYEQEVDTVFQCSRGESGMGR